MHQDWGLLLERAAGRNENKGNGVFLAGCGLRADRGSQEEASEAPEAHLSGQGGTGGRSCPESSSRF